MNQFPLILALDVGEIIGIIFLVVSVLGWFIKVIKGDGNNAPQPAVRQAQAERMRTEIETFLEEISSSSPPRPPAQANPPQRPVDRPRPAVGKSGKKPQKGPKPLQAKQQPKPPRPITSLASQHLPSSQLGEGVRSHVSGYMQSDRIATEVQQDLKGLIPAQVQQEIGRGASVSAVTTATTAEPIHPLITLLKNPQGIRQAIVLQEILQRPRSLRPRDGILE